MSRRSPIPAHMDTEMKTNVPLTAAVVIGLMDPAQSWA